MIKGIDTAKRVDAAWFAAAYNDGFRLYVASTTTVDHWPPGQRTPWEAAPEQMKMALDAGFMIAAYSRDPALWQVGIDAAAPYVDQLQFFAFDIEDSGSQLTRAMVDGVASTGVRPVVYTFRKRWRQIMGGDVTEFADLPLWEAGPIAGWTPDRPADLAKPTPIPFGGWNTPDNPRIGVQQGQNVILHGVKLDTNTFNASFFSPR
ncbi:hypothetical protein CRM90_07590 [Mycobacterium sp. ENV421]|nr:hypothetical protein CRM90_07590 [Mycobacterium sp. ENV421]